MFLEAAHPYVNDKMYIKKFVFIFADIGVGSLSVAGLLMFIRCLTLVYNTLIYDMFSHRKKQNTDVFNENY